MSDYFTNILIVIVQELTNAQVDRLIDHVGEIIKIFGIAVSAITSLFLYKNQKFNKQDTNKRIQNIDTKIRVNNRMTKNAVTKVEEVHKIVTDQEILTDALRKAIKPPPGNPRQFKIKLPSFHEWKRYDYNEGSEVKWIQEAVGKGRRVRYRSYGKAQMFFHSHPVSEKISVVSGTLFVEHNDQITTLHSGESLIILPNELHRVYADEAIELIVDWQEQESDNLDIIVYN